MRILVAVAGGLIMMTGVSQARPEKPRVPQHAVPTKAKAVNPASTAPTTTMSAVDFEAITPGTAAMAVTQDIKDDSIRQMSARMIQGTPALLAQAGQLEGAARTSETDQLRAQVLKGADTLVQARLAPGAKIAPSPPPPMTAEELQRQTEAHARMLEASTAILKGAPVEPPAGTPAPTPVIDPETPPAVMQLAAHGPKGMDPVAVVKAVAAHPELMPQVQWLADNPKDPRHAKVQADIFAHLK